MEGLMDVNRVPGLNLSKAEYDEALGKLCLFGASGSGEYIEELMDFLSLQSLALLDPAFHSVREIFAKTKIIVNFPFEIDEVIESLERLSEKGKIHYGGGMADDAQYRMEVALISQLRTQVKEQEKFEKQVLGNWQQDVSQRHSDLSHQDLKDLTGDLSIYTLRVLSQHAVESVSLYYGDNQDIWDLIGNLADESMKDILPERSDKIEEIRAREFPLFFRNAPAERKKYLIGKMNSVFILYLLQLDPTCAALAKKQIPGGTLYLDTNFVYRLVGLQGESLKASTRRLQELSNALGYKMVVTPRTIEEYKISLDSFLRKARSVPRMLPELAAAALEVTEDEDILTAYWHRICSRGISVDPRIFYEYFFQVEQILFELGIEIVNDAAQKFVTEHDAELAREEKILEDIANQYGYYIRHVDIINHDAFHRLLMLQLRAGTQDTSFIEIRYWFLTCDSKLPKYDRIARSGTGIKTPFCVLASHWLQAIRPFSPAIDGFEPIEIDMLDSPLFRTYKAPPPELVNEIMGRLMMREDFSPKAAVKMILNKQFLEQFSKAPSEQEREIIVNKFYEDYIESLEQSEQKARQERDQAQEELKVLKEKTISISETKSGKIFIGHGRSPLWARVQVHLVNDLKMTVETFESESRTSEHIVDVLRNMLKESSAAILVLTAEDEAGDKMRARQNVVHESGLFQGHLGFEKVFLLLQDGVEEFSNISGLQQIRFSGNNIETTFYELDRALRREKLIE